MKPKQITIDAGKNAINYEKMLDKVYSNMIKFLFEVKNMPECELKWIFNKVFTQQIRQMMRDINHIRSKYG